MVVCQYGSQVKPSVTEDWLWITGTQLCSVTTWLSGALGAVCDQLVPKLEDLQTLCATTPPDPPEIDLYAMAVSGELYQLPQTVLDWIIAVWRQTNWNTYCECLTSGGTCPEYNYTQSHTFAIGSGAWSPWWFETARPTGSTATRVTITAASVSPSVPVSLKVGFFNASNVNLGYDTISLPPGAFPYTAPQVNIPTNTTKVFFAFNITSATRPVSVSCTWVHTWLGNCNLPADPYVPPAEPTEPVNMPPGPPTPVGCTTDVLCSKVQQLQNMLAIIATEVDEIYLWTQTFQPGGQIQAGYQLGTVHAGLQDLGELNLASDILGVSVAVTAISSSAGHSPGLPTVYHGLGHLNLGTADGWDRSVQIHRMAQLVYSQFQPWTKLAWSLSEGTVITVTELIPPPP